MSKVWSPHKKEGQRDDTMETVSIKIGLVQCWIWAYTFLLLFGILTIANAMTENLLIMATLRNLINRIVLSTKIIIRDWKTMNLPAPIPAAAMEEICLKYTGSLIATLAETSWQKARTCSKKERKKVLPNMIYQDLTIALALRVTSRIPGTNLTSAKLGLIFSSAGSIPLMIITVVFMLLSITGE